MAIIKIVINLLTLNIFILLTSLCSSDTKLMFKLKTAHPSQQPKSELIESETNMVTSSDAEQIKSKVAIFSSSNISFQSYPY